MGYPLGPLGVSLSATCSACGAATATRTKLVLLDNLNIPPTRLAPIWPVKGDSLLSWIAYPHELIVGALASLTIENVMMAAFENFLVVVAHYCIARRLPG